MRIFFAKDKYPMKKQFYIYTKSNLVADFGGYLGLLLGYSVLGFFNSLMDFSEHFIRMCKEKFQAKIAKSNNK